MAGIKKIAQIVLASVLLAGSIIAGDQSERKVVQRNEPEYPQIAQRMSLHGSVKLKLWISPDGTVRRVEYVGGHPLLAESALKAVKSWIYESSPKESTAEVQLKF